MIDFADESPYWQKARYEPTGTGAMEMKEKAEVEVEGAKSGTELGQDEVSGLRGSCTPTCFDVLMFVVELWTSSTTLEAKQSSSIRRTVTYRNTITSRSFNCSGF